MSTPFLCLPCSVTQGQAESGGMVLVDYAGPVRPAAALRDVVLCLPTDIHSLLVNKPSSSSSSSLSSCSCSSCSSCSHYGPPIALSMSRFLSRAGVEGEESSRKSMSLYRAIPVLCETEERPRLERRGRRHHLEIRTCHTQKETDLSACLTVTYVHVDVYSVTYVATLSRMCMSIPH